MKVKRIFNNNVVLAYQDDSESVIFGKGIGYQKKHGDSIDRSKIEKLFILSDNQTNKFEILFKEMSHEYADLALIIVKQAERDLKIEFNSNIYISVMDHINYALIRAKQGLFIRNVLLWEIKRTYKKEYDAALNTLKIIKNETGIELPIDEAGIIALHYFNAQDPKNHIEINYKSIGIIQDIIKIVQYHFKIQLDENDINYSRLMTHLRYFAQNLLSNEWEKGKDVEVGFLFEQIKKQYPDTYICALKIRMYIKEELDKLVTDEELMYLMIHMQRIVDRRKEIENIGG